VLGSAAIGLFACNTYQPKEYVFSYGEYVNDVYFVVRGIGRYFYIDRDGKERNKSIVKRGGALVSLKTTVLIIALSVKKRQRL